MSLIPALDNKKLFHGGVRGEGREREKTNYHSDKIIKKMALLKNIALHNCLTSYNFTFKDEVLYHSFVALKDFNHNYALAV